MGDQYHQYPNFQVTEDKYIPQYAMNGGGLPLDRYQALSNDSSISEASFSTNNCMSPPASPLDNMSYFTAKLEYESDSLPQQQQLNSSITSHCYTESVKYTPKFLGWSHNTELLKLYTFIVPKSKEPYFQLRESWTPTYETPKTVYLDQSK